MAHCNLVQRHNVYSKIFKRVSIRKQTNEDELKYDNIWCMVYVWLPLRYSPYIVEWMISFNAFTLFAAQTNIVWNTKGERESEQVNCHIRNSLDGTVHKLKHMNEIRPLSLSLALCNASVCYRGLNWTINFLTFLVRQMCRIVYTCVNFS